MADNATQDALESEVQLLREQVRFFKAAYGIEEGTPFDIIHAATGVMVECTKDGKPTDDVKRVMRHIIAQVNRAETAEARATKLHNALVNVSQVVANALELAAAQEHGRPPMWLLSLGANLDMVLADAALENKT